MLRELAKIAALILCIISIYALLGSAFFVPGSTWQARLASAIETLAITACVCFASGLLFTLADSSTEDQPTPTHTEPSVTPTLAQTLPVQLFFWSLGATILLFLLSRYLEVFYIPYIWKNQPY